MIEDQDILPALPDDVEAKDYWFIQARGISAMWIIKQLIKPFEDEVSASKPLLALPLNGRLTFLIRRDKVPVEQIMRFTGLTQKAIEEKTVIKITEKVVEGLPEPTVSGWGEA